MSLMQKMNIETWWEKRCNPELLFYKSLVNPAHLNHLAAGRRVARQPGSGKAKGSLNRAYANPERSPLGVILGRPV